MKKTMLRNCIIMGVLVVVMAVLLMLYLRAAGSLPGAPGAVYNDGIYTASAEGFSNTTDVAVTVTISGGKLADLTIDASDETPEVGGKAAEELREAILAAGGTHGVDGVSGATWTSNAVLTAVTDGLPQAQG